MKILQLCEKCKYFGSKMSLHHTQTMTYNYYIRVCWLKKKFNPILCKDFKSKVVK